MGGGKDGTLYILNQASLGGYKRDTGPFQVIPTGYHIFSTVAMWNDTIYLGTTTFSAGSPAPLISYALQTSTNPSQFVQQAQTTTPASFGFPGPRLRFRRPEPRTVSSGRSITANTAPSDQANGLRAGGAACL